MSLHAGSWKVAYVIKLQKQENKPVMLNPTDNFSTANNLKTV